MERPQCLGKLQLISMEFAFPTDDIIMQKETLRCDDCPETWILKNGELVRALEVEALWTNLKHTYLKKWNARTVAEQEKPLKALNALDATD